MKHDRLYYVSAQLGLRNCSPVLDCGYECSLLDSRLLSPLRNGQNDTVFYKLLMAEE